MEKFTLPVQTRFPTSPAHAYPLSYVKKLSGLAGAWKIVLLFGLFFIFLSLVQFSTPDLPDNDGFYHLKLAYLMRTEGLKPDFPWLPLTILNSRDFYDHHFLYHVGLIPFTFGDLRLGAKWSSVFFASLAFLCVWRLFKNQRIPYPSLWALGLLAVSEAFIYRMSIPRAQSLSLAALALGLNWLLQRKYTHLAVLGFVYVWLYNAFPLLLALAGVYVLADWLINRRLELRPLLYVGAGISLGLILNPYFPDNLVFVYHHFLPKLTETTAIRVGNEWYPYDTSQLLRNSPLALAAFLSGVLAVGLSGKRMDVRTTASFLLACLFGLMLFQSRRFIEYFPAFALVFAAFAWEPLVREKLGASPNRPGSADHALGKKLHRLGISLPALALLLVLIPGLWLTFQASRASIQRSKPYGLYAGASAWLAANTPAGARVFQTDWDDFPRLFFYNTHNTYLIGLDPTYLLLEDEDLYAQWVDITQGEVEQPSEMIAKRFRSEYVITDLQHEDFLAQAESDSGLVEVYRDEEAVVFQVNQ
jgi:hypothetical protein